MNSYQTNITIRNNPNLKAPNASEIVSEDEYKRRVTEIIRCKKDPIYFAENYFTIVSPKLGKHIIKLYPKQKELIEKMVSDDRVCILASRQVGKTTAYNVFSLWYTMFHPDKKILICANKAAASLEFLDRIRLAYELLPNWLKPGVKVYNKGKIEFGHESSIEGTATSPATARGKACNVLILDEFAFVDGGIAYEFWQSVYPIISSSIGTKVFMVSTPNGTGNIFYETYERARLGIDKDGWTNFRIDWWEVPDRDDEWKQKQIASLNGDMRAWAQEFGNKFHGSTYTLIDAKIIEKYKQLIISNQRKPKLKSIDKNGMFKMRVWEDPKPDHAYILGSDVADGVGKDYSVILVIDVTDTANVRIVASFSSNKVSTVEFAFILAKIGTIYNNACVAVEANGIGRSIIDSLWNIYEYDNLVSVKNKTTKYQKGIWSHNSVKVNACLWLRNLTNTEEISIDIPEENLVYEMEWFEKKMSTRDIYQAVNGKHDDYVMAFVWGMYVLSPKLVENYFEVGNFLTTKFGIEIPSRLQPFNSVYFSDSFAHNYKNDVDDVFQKLISGEQNKIREVPTQEEDFKHIGFFNDESYEEEWL